MVPTPLYYGLGIDWNLLLPLMLVFMITSLETIGDITATSDVSEQPVSGPLYMKRLKGGVLANGLNSFVSAVFNTFPNSCFGQNNGVIQLTGVAQPLRWLCGCADADRARFVPGGERLCAAYP